MLVYTRGEPTTIPGSAMPASNLLIYTLGRFDVLRDREPITDSEWGTHRGRRLFKLLLTRYGEVVGGEQIMDLLWPDATPKSAARELYKAVSELRRALEPNLAKPSHSIFIRSTESGYRFNTHSPHILDTDLFISYTEAARTAAKAGAWELAARVYAQASALYAGDYLPDDLYADWAAPRREGLRRSLVEMLLEMAETQARIGRYGSAITSCRRALELDPYLETAYRALMLYQYLAGDRLQSLRVFAECATMLEREFGIGPLPATRDLAEQIRAGQVSGVDRQPSYPTPEPPAVPYSFGRLPFVSRETERRELARAVERAQHGRGSMLVVSGEAGIGKSALIDNVLRRDGIPAVLSTHAHELTQGMPFHPMAELLREARRQYAPAQVPMWAAPIATIVPELDAEHMHPRAPTAVAPAYDKDHLFEALRRYLVELTNRVAQLIIVIEDVQWADAATIDFLLYLAPRLPHSPLLVIVTCRPEARLEPLLAHDGRVDWLRRLPLAALDEPAVLALVISLTGEGAQSSRAFASRLYRATGGNPLFVDSTLRMLFERGDLWLGGDGQTQGLDELVTAPVWPVPKELQALLTRRTSTLTEAAQRVLRIAAVVEDAVEIDLLHALCTDHAAVEPLGEASLLDAVDELIAAELLDAAKDAALSFRHDVVREAVYAGLSAPRRQRLHLAVAAALEARREGDVPDRLTRASLVAEHFLRGRSWDKAVSYLIEAGDAAASIHADAEARSYYSHALDALAKLEETADVRRQREDTFVKLAKVAVDRPSTVRAQSPS